ncbi:GumC family protein [Novipirellula sp. SH528]|uniref:GumC family protein n=1 Tax=Novipirellula sp. SH528 TaxID=3454466 RepID=UPI003F9FE329
MKNDSAADHLCRVTASHREPLPEAKPVSMPLHQGIPEFSDLLLACRHHAILTFVVGAFVATGLSGLAWSLIRPSYHAEALVRVREQQDFVFSAQTSRSEDIAFFRSQAALVKSHQVLTAAFEDEEVQPYLDSVPAGNRVDWLEELLRVETQSGSGVISVNVQHESPEIAKAFCNAITRAYLAEITHRLSSDRQRRETQLEQAAIAADLELDKLWEDLNRVAETVGSDNAESLTIRDEMQFQSYRDYAHQLQAAQLRGNQLQSELDELQLDVSQRSRQEPKLAEGLLQQNGEVLAARKRLTEIELQFQQIEKIAASSDSPQMRRLQDQREFQVKELEEIIQRIRSGVNERLQLQMHNDNQVALAKLRQQVELNRKEKEFLRERLSELNPVVARATRKTAVPLDMSRHAVERQSRLSDSLWKTLQEFRIEGNSQPRIMLQALAMLPQHANHSRQLKASAASGASGCILIVFIIGYLEWRDCRVRSPRDVMARSRFPVFGTNSYAGKQFGLKLAFRRNVTSSGVREAAARIFMRKQNSDDTITLMVTSCVANEPRHLISTELAVVLGGFGRSVLLIDCDTDRAQSCAALGASVSMGVRQIPGGKQQPTTEAVDKLIVATDQSEVDFLPIGTATTQGGWIDPRTLRHAIGAMKAHYDVIIVTGPSMMGSAENALLAEEVDSSAISVFIDQSRWSQLVLCEDSSQQSGVAISGCILHHGTCESALQLQQDRPRRTRTMRQTDAGIASEDELRSQIDEMQKELDWVQGAGADLDLDAEHTERTTDQGRMASK